MLKQRCKIASKNVNFTYDDAERPLFIDNKSNKTPQEIKTGWTDKTFGGPWLICSYNEISALNASINVEYTDLKQVRNTNYILIEVHNELKYYFVTNVTIKNEHVAVLKLYLDTVTTYLDNINFTNDVLVKRTHFDRYTRVNDKSYIINMSKDSGIWNDEPDIPQQTLVPKAVQPINVLDYFNIPKDDDEPKYRQFIENMRTTFYPYAFMKYRDYGFSWMVNNSNGFHNAGKPVYQYNSKFNGSNFYSSVWTLSPWFVNKLKLKGVDGHDYTMASPGYVNSEQAAHIIKIYGLPLPLHKITSLYKDGDYNDIIAPLYEIEGNHLTHIQDAGIDARPTGIITPSDTDIVVGDTYSGSLTIPHDIQHEVDNFNYIHYDPKIYTSQHTKHIISSVNGQSFELVNEYIMNQSKIDFNIDQAITTEGALTFFSITGNSYYDVHNKDNSKRLVISWKDQLPSASSVYADWMAANANQYKTAQANARRSQTWGIVSSLIGGVAGAGAAIASGGLSTAKNAMARATIGASQSGISGALSGAGALIQGRNRLAELQAKQRDLTNLGGTTELDDISIIKDTMLGRLSTFGDTKLVYSTYMPVDVQIRRLDAYYKKYGYACENFERIASYNHFNRRQLFTYFEISNFKTGVDKSSVPIEVLDDLERLFYEGVRLWNVKSDGDVNISDFHTPNLELSFK